MKIRMTEQDAFGAFHEKMKRLGETLVLEGRLPGHPTRVVWQTAVEALGLEFESVPSERPLSTYLVTSRQNLQGGGTVPILVDGESGQIATDREYQEAAGAYNWSSHPPRQILHDSAASASKTRGEESSPVYALYASPLDKVRISKETWRGDFESRDDARAAGDVAGYEWYKVFKVTVRELDSVTYHSPVEPITQEDIDAAFEEDIERW